MHQYHIDDSCQNFYSGPSRNENSCWLYSIICKITRTRYFYIRVLLKRQTWDNLETSFETSALSLLYAIKLIYPYPRFHQFTVRHLIG